jgi:hypothetical protein
LTATSTIPAMNRSLSFRRTRQLRFHGHHDKQVRLYPIKETASRTCVPGDFDSDSETRIGYRERNINQERSINRRVPPR